MSYQFKSVFTCRDPKGINKIIFFIMSQNELVGYLNGVEVIQVKTKTTYEQIDLSDYRCKLQTGNNEFLIELKQITTGLLESEICENNQDNILFDAEIVLI